MCSPPILPPTPQLLVEDFGFKHARIAVVVRFPCLRAKILTTTKSEASSELRSAQPIFQISQRFFRFHRRRLLLPRRGSTQESPHK
ncbi:hypothetical protein Y032_0385g423 [Ancylostoma ceylanicum]|uniref:Uncharacterized protein n=1 Tax=Ancylostoma ceylanicum TaxID=53326 RepID=A0A016RSL1_9BILA|nr:hypothetical protein Y032_0385g423 [Ancylostoma ceylanicum]